MQRYQVFINEHLILLTDASNSFTEENADFDSFTEMKQLDIEELQLVINWLFVEQEARYKVVLSAKNIANLWNDFLASFQLIEAAGGLVKNESNQLLMIYRLNKWDLPKGKIEKGEGIQEAAIREVEEECGVKGLTIVDELAPTFHMYVHKENKVLKKTHWFSMNCSDSSALKPQEEESIEAVEWVNQGQLPSKIAESYASLKPLLKGFV